MRKAFGRPPACRTCTKHALLHVHPALRLQGIEGMIALVPDGHDWPGGITGWDSITSHLAHLAYDNGGPRGV